MSKEMYISSSPHETKVAVLEDDQLVEVYFERDTDVGLVGGIYKGRVNRVLPGMQSAFVDIGLERDAFLYVSDFFYEDQEEYDKVFEEAEARATKLTAEQAETPAAPAGTVAAPEARPALPAAPPPAEAAPPAPPAAAPAPAEAPPAPVAPPPFSPPSGPRETYDRRPFDPRRGRRRRHRGRNDFRENRHDDRRFPPAQRREEFPAEPHEFEVLPGESLAKYKHPAATVPEEPGAAMPGEGAGTVRDNVAEDASTTELPAGVVDEAGAGPTRGFPAPEMTELRVEVSRVPAPFSEATEVESAPLPVADAAPAPPSAGSSPLAPTEATTVVAGAQATIEAEAVPIPAAIGVAEPVAPEVPPAPVLAEATTRETAPAQPPALTEATEAAPALSALAGAEATIPQAEPASSTAEPTVDEPVLLDNDEAVEEEGVGEEEISEEEEEFAEGAEDELTEEGEGTAEGEPAEEASVVAEGERAVGAPETAPGEAPGAATPGEAGDRTYTLREPSQRPRFAPRRRRGRRGDRGPRRFDRPRESSHAGNHHPVQIAEVLKEGQEIIVQIAKEPLGTKGARITSHVALPGRYLVYMPTIDHIGVSRKISSEEERLRLRNIILENKGSLTGGFIVRTAGQGRPEEEFKADLRFLSTLWGEIRSKADRMKAPVLLHRDLDLVQRLLRDLLTPDFKCVRVDSEIDYERVLDFVNRCQPSLIGKVKLYTRDTPLYEEFGIQQELDKALKPKVWLKSGGYIVINQTEALVAIDVNTGKYVGKTNRLEDTIVKTNVDAVNEIVRQVRLRDLGGIIVIDFIDMDERKNRAKVVQALEEALRGDRAPTKVISFHDFGLVAVTRKRVKQSLERTLCQRCDYCSGSGWVKSVNTVCNEILAEARKMAKGIDGNVMTLRVSPEVAKALKSREGNLISELESLTKKDVIIKGDPMVHQERFEIF